MNKYYSKMHVLSYRKTTKIRVITHYNPNNPYFRTFLKKYKDTLILIRKQALSPSDIEVTYAKSAKLRNILLSGQCNAAPSKKLCQPCYKKHCKTWRHMDTNMAITNRNMNSFPIRGDFNCQSKNAIYCHE